MNGPPRRPLLHRLASNLSNMTVLDGPAAPLLKLSDKALRPSIARDALSGTFLGHALHPLMTDLPIGAWTSAVLLDAFGGRDSRTASRRLVGFGIVSSVPTAVTGYVEWADSARGRPATRRVGVVHAAANVTALTLFSASYLARRQGSSGRRLALAGFAMLGVGGHLGGHLSYVHGEGVAVTTFEEGSREWASAIPESQLMPEAPACVEVAGVPVMVVREGGRILALANRCTHRGGPLHEGVLEDGTVTCPWHGSRFDLENGGIERGPSASPQPAYETRVAGGMVEVRQVTDPTP